MGSSNAFNPQTTIDYYNQQSKNYRLTGNAFAEVKFAKNFTFKTSIMVILGQNEVSNYVPVYTRQRYRNEAPLAIFPISH